ncbi:MAG: pseudouridine synthase [Gammaproteobacteria bacterium]|nr:pseudouridine synthase [Gammaproteobacteria bacterium]
MIVLFNKPFNVLSQFTDKGTDSSRRKTLADYIDIPNIYPAGRLDRDSEGLLILTDDGQQQATISSPKFKTEKTYWAQLDNIPDEKALDQLRNGIQLKDGMTRPAKIQLISEPENLWPREPPIRYRKEIPTQWIELRISEGKNRQVRRMTAAVGFPTLRLIRARIGEWGLTGLQPGEYRIIA